MPNGAEPIAFGPLLRRQRLAAGLTQEALAARAGLGTRSIQHLEGGAHQPHRETIERLIEVLGLVGAERQRFEAAAQPAPRSRDTPVGVLPATTTGPASNLPLVRTSFVGREREV